MNGVTILNSYEYLTNTSSIVGMIFLCMWSLAGTFIALFELIKRKGNSWIAGIIFIVCITLTITFGGLIPKKKYETQYQVTVDDSVSMNEFQNKYEIIKVEGKIYTGRDRVK